MAKDASVANISRAAQGGIAVTKLKAIVARIRSLKGSMDSIRGDLGQEYKQAEDDHEINRQMLKWAVKLTGQDADKGQQNFRDLESYCNKLGLFDQTDLIADSA